MMAISIALTKNLLSSHNCCKKKKKANTILQESIFERQVNSIQPYIFKILSEKHFLMKVFSKTVYLSEKNQKPKDRRLAALRSEPILNKSPCTSVSPSVKLR